MKPRARIGWSLAGLFLFCLCYYGSYFRCGFGLSDEASAFLLADRIAQGERPLRDLTTGYNVLWHYQIAGLFSLFGKGTVVLRVYFYLLATATSLLACDAVRRTSGSLLGGLGAGLLLALFPGPVHKTPIALMVVLQIWLWVRLNARSPDWKNWIAPGLATGWSMLLRIDLGLSFTAGWLVLLGLSRPGWRSALQSAGALLATILALQFAMLGVAWQQGYAPQFADQYAGYGSMIQSLMHRPPPPAAPVQPTVAQAPPTPTLLAPQALPAPGKGWDAKKSLSLLTRAPFLTAGLIFLIAAWLCFRGASKAALTALGSLGFAFCAFPQFYFFRPDYSHLAQFMTGFSLAILVAASLRQKYAAWFIWLIGGLHLLGYTAAIWKHPAGGAAWSVPPGLVKYDGPNGVSVFIREKERREYQKMQKLVATWSRPGEYLLAMPYLPGWNVIADRPTYLRSVFGDDVTYRLANWDVIIEEVRQRQPTIFVYSDRPLNATEQSRFSRWGKPLLDYIEANYIFREKISGCPVYTLRKEPLTDTAGKLPPPGGS